MCIHRNSASAAQTTPPREVLPTNVTPVHYELEFEPIFDGFTFNGRETIDFTVNETTDYITLNSLDIKISEAKINDVPISDISFDEELQRVTFKFSDHLASGTNAKLHLKFVGELNDKMCGFYRLSYREDGKTKYVATTQMEPTDARRAFPCYDEPSAKAKFTISLIADKDLVCLSNMNESTTTLLENGKKKVEFATSVIMSTYLVAFIVGDLKYVEDTSYRVPIRVYATPGTEHLGQYGADIAAKTLKFFDEKFDIPYPLPKCDMVAIHDFSAGAMENFGLVTYRTIDLLVDPKAANARTLQRVTEVVMHELAHQWFGNLVTMDFWDGLWLNEGFATWMSWYACDALVPEWKVWESYVGDSLQHALGLDALRSSHPVEVPISRADQINQIFDAISYSKGSSLLKMISKWLGEDTFIKGVSNYLKKHKWTNTQTSDLWAALSEVSGKDVVAVMDTWTKKIGYPVVEVTEGADHEITLTQHRFLATGDLKPKEDGVLYPIFLGLKTSEGIDESQVLDTRSKKIKLSDDFFKVNGDQFGVYRTAYSSERYAKLGKSADKLSVSDRIGLVADAGALSSSGHIKTSDLLNLVKLWTKEDNYVVWDEILGRISTIKAAFVFESESTREALNAFVLDLVSDKLQEVGWEFSDSDSFADQQLKTSLFESAAASNHPEVLKFIKESFAAYVKDPKAHPINSNLRPAIFYNVAKHGDATTYDQLFNIYQNPSSQEEKLVALRSLGKFTSAELLDRVCDLFLNTEVLKNQDIYMPMQTMRSHPAGIERLWKWVTTNWDRLYADIPPSLSMLGSVVILSSAAYTKKEQKQKVEAFYKSKDTRGFELNLAQSLDMISSKISWVDRDSNTISEWLSTNGYSKGSKL